MAKKKNILASTDAYVITKDIGSEYDYIRIRSKSETWSLCFRSDSPMYGVWAAMCRDKNYSKGMEVMCTMAYMLTNSFLDEQFISEFFESINAMYKRRSASKPEPGEVEQENARNEAQAWNIAEKEIQKEV